MVFAALSFFERIALIATAFVFVRRGAAVALVSSAVLAILVAARGVLRASVWSGTCSALYRRLVEGLLHRDLFRTSPFASDDPEAMVFEAVDAAAKITVDHRPALLADGLAVLCVAIVFATTQSAQTLAIGLAALLVTSLVLVLSRARTAAESEREWEAYRPVAERLLATLHARLEIVGNGAAFAFRDALSSELRAWRAASARAERVLGAAGRAPLFLGGAVVVCVFVFARALQNGVTFDVIADAAVFGAALPPFAGLARTVHEMRKLRGRASLLDAWLEGAPTKSAESKRSDAEAIEWKDFSFRYPSATRDALSHVDLRVEAADCLILKGANGSGKSTLLKSLLGGEAIEQGQIIQGPTALARDDAWRRTVAYLPQRPYLGERSSAREALSLFGEGVESDRARKWLERLALWDVLAKKNSDDPLSARVGSLSSGERQRLALARFFSLDRDTYLLDEPDANLDAAGVAAVVEIVAELAKTKRVIVAAHTPELVRVGRTVVELENGRIRNPLEAVSVPRPAGNPLQEDA